MKLIIDIPEAEYECAKQLCMSENDDHKRDYYKPQWMSGNSVHKLNYYISNGIPLDSNSEQDEVQAYYAGMSYGWEQGRKDLIDDVKAEFINAYPTNDMDEPKLNGIVCHFSLNTILQILDNIGKESEIHCNHTDEEIAKSFISDVEAVKDLLPRAESEDKE